MTRGPWARLGPPLCGGLRHACVRPFARCPAHEGQGRIRLAASFAPCRAASHGQDRDARAPGSSCASCRVGSFGPAGCAGAPECFILIHQLCYGVHYGIFYVNLLSYRYSIKVVFNVVSLACWSNYDCWPGPFQAHIYEFGFCAPRDIAPLVHPR